jgi:hypothetical protein
MSATIIPFLEHASFDSDMVNVLGKAYDSATTALHDTGQSPVVREVLARRIIEIAKTGERDPQRLSQLALAALGLERD